VRPVAARQKVVLYVDDQQSVASNRYQFLHDSPLRRLAISIRRLVRLYSVDSPQCHRFRLRQWCNIFAKLVSGAIIMNLKPVQVDDIPVGKPLPWRLYDRNGFIVLARGEMVASREQLAALFAAGLLRDVDAPVPADGAAESMESAEAARDMTFPPSGIKPQVGELVQLLLPKQPQPAYYSVRLIGYVTQQSILVMTPMTGGVPLILADGEPLEVRMVTGNNIYTFQTAIQRLCISPVHYLHLDYPALVRVQTLRRSPWVRVNLSATATDAQGARQLVRIDSLSANGARIQATDSLGEPGATLRIAVHVELDEMSTTLNLAAAILHVQAPAGGNGMEYSIEFRDVPAADALWLKGVVYRNIAEGNLA
jgi:Flagellar protein YcgR/PilZ domain